MIFSLFEDARPCTRPNFEEIGSFLAIIERGNKPLRYNPQKWIFPAGAGLVICKQAWLENVPKHPQPTFIITDSKPL